MELHITKIARFTKKQDGTPLLTKDGRPYTSIRIKTTEHGDKWLSGFENAETKNWKEGDAVEAEVEQKGEYLNFRVPKKEDKLSEALLRIENKLQTIAMMVNVLYTNATDKKPHYPTHEEEGIDDEPAF